MEIRIKREFKSFMKRRQWPFSFRQMGTILPIEDSSALWVLCWA